MYEYSDYSPQYYDIHIPKVLRSYLDEISYASLLDAGCGDGALLYALYKAGYCTGKQVYALDISPKSIELVRGIDSNIDATVDSVESMASIPTSSIDVLVSSMVIEHVDDTKMIRAINRVLRANGMVYLETVYKKWYGWYFTKKNGKTVLDITHLREYTQDSQLLSLIDMKQYRIRESQKILLWFPLMDFMMRKLNIRDRGIFEGYLMLRLLRKISLPIIGYYRWVIVLQKIV